MGPAVRFLGTHHVAISTSRFERLREFYVETLGLPIVGWFPGHAILFLAAGTTTIELIGTDSAGNGPDEAGSAADAGRPGWHHFALEVEDVDAAYAALLARGVPFSVPPEGFPPEAPSMRIAFFQDPDGNLLELIQPLGSRYPGPAARDVPPARYSADSSD